MWTRTLGPSVELPKGHEKLSWVGWTRADGDDDHERREGGEGRRGRVKGEEKRTRGAVSLQNEEDPTPQDG